MTGGALPIRATFWLLDSSDSMLVQSRREPDGAGLGWFGAAGAPHVVKSEHPAYSDPEFIRNAQSIRATTCVAHLRYASTGPVALQNTHPFASDNLIFAHNGELQGLPQLEAHIGDAMTSVEGDTDSERYFALIRKEIARHDGDVSAGIRSAVSWIAEQLPVFALNFVMVSPHELWALRYPEEHELYVLHRTAGGQHGGRHLDAAGTCGTVRVQSSDLQHQSAVVVASEPLDEHPDWQLIRSGELVHVARDLTVSREIVIDAPPAHRLTLADLDEQAAAAQAV
jgi:glutamine amidotransferase